MSILRELRGMFPMTGLLTKLAKVLVGQLREMLTPKQLQRCPEVVRRSLLFAAVALVVSFARADGKAELHTYERNDGHTFYALSLTPEMKDAAAPSTDVVILFDTSASQTGPYRDTSFAALEACIAKLRPEDRVQLLAVDLEARPITEQFVAAGSPELRAAIEKLHGESPLGSTDMESVLRTTATRFDEKSKANRAVIYIGDGMSTANLIGTPAFAELVKQLRAAHAPMTSYAIGPRRDNSLLAAVANQTGGNLYIDDAMAAADDSAGVTAERANEENLRRGGTVGAMLADWAQAKVLWPEKATFPTELGEVLPKLMPPLRADRDTVLVGEIDKKIEAPAAVTVQIQGAGDLSWTAKPQAGGDDYAYLAQVVDSAQNDGGLTLTTVGSAGLAETGRMLDRNLEAMTDMAQRAVATGDVAGAETISQAVLRRDPGNIRAQTVQQIVHKPQVAAADLPGPEANAAQADPDPFGGGASSSGNSGAPSGDLNLVRPKLVPPQSRPQAQPMPAPAGAGNETDNPAPGSLVDKFDQSGAFMDQVEQQKRVFAQMLRKEIDNTVIDARRQMADNPEAASQQLKLALQNVERAPELSPDMRAQLVDKLQIALREVQRAASIKDEMDAARQEELAAARERQLLNERLARNEEKESQLMARFASLMDERRFDEAVEVAAVVRDIDPDGVTPAVATAAGQLQRNNYLQQVARAARWRNFFDTLYTVETSAIPFPDEPPIVYPPTPVWEDLTNRRKKFASVDLKAAGSAEEKINAALTGPLKDTGMEYTETPLEQVVSQLQEEYGIPILLDTPALQDAGINPQDPVTVNLHNIALRSALRLMLKQHQLTYIISNEVLTITTPEQAETQLVTKVYPVADLVLPIETPSISGGGMGGGGLGGGGGSGGGGGGLGGGGGGGFGGGGGGQFSVPDQDDHSAKTQSAPGDLSLHQSSEVSSSKAIAGKNVPVATVQIDETVKPDEFWNQYFATDRDPAVVRQTARELMGKKKYDQAIAMIEAALRHGQSQSWMYESLGIGMELAGRSKPEIERAVMSAADFSTTADQLLYIAEYLARIGLDKRACQVCQQVVKIEPLRREAYALGLKTAQRCDDLSGIEWATVGILSQAWPKDEQAIRTTATRVSLATLERLANDGRTDERDAYRQQLQAAGIRDCVVQVSWTGNADVDIEVNEPSGTVCSATMPRTAGGGVSLGDSYASTKSDPASAVMSESYVCPEGFAGTYRVRIHRVWGEVTAGKVTVDVYTHVGTDQTKHERQQINLGEKDALVVFDLDAGRRNVPLEASQLAGAVQRQQDLSRAVMGEQISGLEDPRALPPREQLLLRNRALGLGGAVGYQPIIMFLQPGTNFAAQAIISADRRYVRVTSVPSFSQIGDVTTFTFAGAAQQNTGGGGTGGGGTGAGGGLF